jgi:hypothetical protein
MPNASPAKSLNLGVLSSSNIRMPATDSPPVLVARFLKANGYEQTLAAFIEEAGVLPEDANVNPGDLTIEKVLDEKRLFDLAEKFEKVQVVEKDEKWTEPGVYCLSSSCECIEGC